MKEIVNEIVTRVLYSNIHYPVVGNRSVLAANTVLANCGIYDINTISSLAKVIDRNAGLELSKKGLDSIHRKLSKIIQIHKSKAFEF